MPEKFETRDYESYEDLPEEEKENFKKVDNGFTRKEALSEDEAQEQAEKMREKIASGEAKDYDEAEKLVDNEKWVNEKETGISLREFLVYDNPKKEEYQKLIKEVTDEKLTERWSSDNYLAPWTDMWRWKLEKLEKAKEEIAEENKEISQWIKIQQQKKDAGFLDEKGAQLIEDILKKSEQRIIEVKQQSKSCIEEMNFFEEKLKGGTLIDLGGGTMPTMAKFAETSKSEFYINVEKNWPDENPINPEKDIADKRDKEEYLKMQYVVVKDDMLDFVSKLPDNSANFTINGINYQIIKNQKYHKALAQELVRATKEGGIIFGVQSDVFNYLSGEEFKDKVRKIEKGRTERIFEKMKIGGNKETNHETE